MNIASTTSTTSGRSRRIRVWTGIAVGLVATCASLGTASAGGRQVSGATVELGRHVHAQTINGDAAGGRLTYR